MPLEHLQEMIGLLDDFEERGQEDLLNEQLLLAYGEDALQVCRTISDRH